MRAAVIPPIVLAAAALAPGGCGATSQKNLGQFKDREHDVAKTVYDLRDAAQRRDASKICDDYLTGALKADLALKAKATNRGKDCADELSDSLRDADSFDITVESVKVNGNDATVQIKTKLSHGKNPTDTLQLSNQQGWRLNALPSSG